MIKLYIKFLLFISVLLSCSDKRTIPLKSSDDSLVTLPVMKHYYDEEGKQYFIRSIDGRIYITDGHYLHHFFDDKYCNVIKDYDTFLSSLSNEPVNINLDDSVNHFRYYVNSFTVDKEISVYYEKKGLIALQKKYCIYDKDNSKLFFKPLPANKKLTIAYYHWINGYKYQYGGVSGYEYLINRGKNGIHQYKEVKHE
jgi:hypothetical protein